MNGSNQPSEESCIHCIAMLIHHCASHGRCTVAHGVDATSTHNQISHHSCGKIGDHVEQDAIAAGDTLNRMHGTFIQTT
jgi:hypothetical protein